MKRLTLIALGIITALVLVIPANAGGIPQFSMSDAQWAVGCVNDYGVVTVDIDIYVPDSLYYVIDQTNTDGLDYSKTVYLGDYFWSWSVYNQAILAVPVDHAAQVTYNVFSADDQLLATGGAYGNCVTGEIRAWGSEVSDVHPPDPSERVMGNIVSDTPVFSQPDPGAAVEGAVLTAGQTWFVVDSQTGADGAVWYELFVAGLHNGWIPASAVVLDGPIP